MARWMTNRKETDADTLIRDLEKANPEAHFYKGPPQATKIWGSEDLAYMGFVGIYMEEDQNGGDTMPTL